MSKAKFNYSTQSISAKNEIEDYLKKQGVDYEIKQETSEITGNTTFDITIILPLTEAEHFARARQITGDVKFIAGKYIE